MHWLASLVAMPKRVSRYHLSEGRMMAEEMIVRRVFATGTGEREAKFLIPSATAWVAEWLSEPDGRQVAPQSS